MNAYVIFKYCIKLYLFGYGILLVWAFLDKLITNKFLRFNHYTSIIILHF